MEKSKYNEYWHRYFHPQLVEIEQENDNTIYFDSASLKEKVYQNYENYKNFYKSIYQFDEKRIDRHKISALFVISCVDSNPFTIENPNKKSTYLSNCFFSLNCGIIMLKDLILESLKENFIKKDISKELFNNIEEGKFLYPNVIQESINQYEIILIRELYIYENRNKNKIDIKNPICLIAFLAHIFFHLERYNLSVYGLIKED